MTPALPPTPAVATHELCLAAWATLGHRVCEDIAWESTGRVFIIEWHAGQRDGTVPIVATEQGARFATDVRVFLHDIKPRFLCESPQEIHARRRLAFSRIARAMGRLDLHPQESARLMRWVAERVSLW